MNNITLSAFGDEGGVALEDQLELLNALGVDGLDFRTAWGTAIMNISDDEARKVRTLCDEAGITVRCLGSPVGKSQLAAPIEEELNNLDRLFKIGEILGTNNIRIFSFYPEDTSTNTHYDQHVPETIDRLSALTEKAASANFVLLHENENRVVGDTPERCLKLVTGVNHPNFRLIWDPANYVHVGVSDVVDKYWHTLSPYVDYIHIKDKRSSDGIVTPAGEGDGQLPELLTQLKAEGFSGVLSVEPHLSGTYPQKSEAMTVAVNALHKLIAHVELV